MLANYLDQYRLLMYSDTSPENGQLIMALQLDSEH